MGQTKPGKLGCQRGKDMSYVQCFSSPSSYKNLLNININLSQYGIALKLIFSGRSMDYLLICTGMVGRGLTMASLGPRSSVSGETQVGSASETGFIAFSDLFVAPEVCYWIHT